MSSADSDRRREERSRLPMAVRCTIEAQGAIEVLLFEVSLTGCQITETKRRLEPNCCIELHPPAMHGLPGTIRWATDDAAGIEFDRPLHEAILKHLLYEPDASTAGSLDFIDTFGRRLPNPFATSGAANERRRSPGRLRHSR